MGSMTALDMLIVRKQFLVNKKGSLFLSFLEEASFLCICLMWQVTGEKKGLL
jgi:hypothetical protein